MVAPPAARAQGSTWEIELHGGGVLPSRLPAGAATLPGPGEPFTTAGVYGPPAPPVLVVATSRRVSSWFFGDGPVLFDQAATAVSANPVAMTAPFGARIVALDPVLGRSLGDMPRGGSVGIRLSRTITTRLTAEVNLDYAVSTIQVTAANQEAVEDTRASFTSAFTGMITSNPGRILRSVGSTAVIENGRARRLFASGALLINLNTRTRVRPYVVVGAGLVSLHGVRPSAALTGAYQFSSPSGATFNETDSVKVADSRDRRSPAGVLGGGLKYDISPRWGVRLDVRAFIAGNPGRTELDAEPAVTFGQLPAGRVTLNANPTIQFGNSPNPVTGLGVTAVAPSTLSGPTLSGVETWKGHGITTYTNVAAGLFWRF